MKIRLAILIIIAALVCVRSSHAREDAVAAAKARLVNAVWEYHLAVVRQVGTAQQQKTSIDLAEFGRAVDAIEVLTDIHSNTATRVGRIPSPELPQAIRRWEEWYIRNHRRLDVDLRDCSLRINVRAANP